MEKHSTQPNNQENTPTNTWVLDTTQAMREPGGRDLIDYKEFLGFDEKELEGKTILDLGSGSQEKLARDLKESGISANVISLNPDYSLRKYRRIINNQEDWQRKSVSAVGQSLPFKENSFDIVLALESVTMYEDAFTKPDNARAWSNEIARVLKPGGKAIVGELLGMGGNAQQEAWQKIIISLESLGLTALIESFKIKEKNSKPRYRLVIKKPLVN